jgi:hypothetical protein
MATGIFIVSRTRAGLYEVLCREFADAPDMHVVLDRRLPDQAQSKNVDIDATSAGFIIQHRRCWME